MVGRDLGGKAPHSRRAGARLWLLQRALEWLAKGSAVSSREVEAIVGHLVVAALFQRCVLARLTLSWLGANGSGHARGVPPTSERPARMRGATCSCPRPWARRPSSGRREQAR